MIRYIADHRGQYGVEPICTTLQFAPSTYYAAVARPTSARQVRDEELKPEIAGVHKKNFSVYGVDKVWRQLLREGVEVGRDRVARLMGVLGLAGAIRGKVKRTTVPGEIADRPGDLVNREFKAPAPNRLWVCDLTYVSTWAGFVYVAFVIDVFSRRIVGWRVSTTLQAELALDALEMAIWARRGSDLGGLVHHSDRGVQYLAIRYTDRLAEAGAVRSVGSKGDSYDNALAETVNGLYKTEVIHRQGPWRGASPVEQATAGWVDWWNHQRLHSALDYLPPVEFETRYHDNQQATEAA
jgi:putative transposase